MRTQHAHEQGQDHGHRHDHAHHHGHDHGPDHAHAHEHNHEHAQGTALTVRALSGLSGDMMLSGLAALAGLENGALDSLVKELKLPALDGGLTLLPHAVNQISGVRCSVTLPREHAHRSLADIAAIIQASAMPQAAQDAAMRAFRLLAEAEAAVHGKTADQVTFHEVGALDSIVDTCLVCRLFTMLAPARFVCSPLPLADGGIVCAHGHIPAPAPAVLRMLEGVPVNAFQGRGETVTPTALSLLKALGAEFGPWPAMTISKTVISYGDTVFHDAPNGAIWALGPCYNSSHFTAPSS